MTNEEYTQAIDNTIKELTNLNKCPYMEDFCERLVNLKDVIAIVKKNLVR